MSQLSLNVVAISVFVVTMASLLGPIVHLSPVVPAIFTAGVLGVATLDTLGWQGQGATVLLEWLAGFSAEHRSRVVRHEAGHFLVATVLGIPVTGYALSAWDALKQGQAGQGGVRFDTQELETELQTGTLSAQLLDRYCTIWMAGIAAETLAFGTIEGGADDRQKLRAVLGQLRLPGQVNQQRERWAILRAKTLLEEHAAAYEALVAAMEQQASVVECHQAIEQHLITSV